jgi:tRNA nucleotidyltransferase (CCA-adding enzyme)
MRNVSELLKKSLPAGRLDLIRRAAAAAERLGMPMYMVGGFVRDLLLGRPGLDFDLVVEGDAIRLARELARKHGGKVTAHSRFGTAKWAPPKSKGEAGFPGTLDLISARAEIYRHPAALPTIKPGDLSADLRRRDFTLNTLAIGLDEAHFGQLRDELGGERDLERGLVRVLHPGSFVDDPTRLYRAVRYEQRYGFHIAPDALALIPEARPYVEKLSAQRLRHELDLILAEPRAAGMLGRLAELELLKAVHRALPWDHAVRQRLEAPRHPELLGYRADKTAKAHPGAKDERGEDNREQVEAAFLNWILWLAALPAGEIESINRRLHFSAALNRALAGASDLMAALPSLSSMRPSGWAARLEGVPLPAVYAVSLAATGGRSREMLENYLLRWRHVKPKISGADLKRRGLQPGPQYQKILRRLRDAWLDGEVRSDEEESRLLERLLTH